MLKRFFISMLGTMAGLWVALFLLFFAGMLALGIAIGKGSGDSMVKVEKHSALYFDLSGEVAERVQPADFMQLLQQAENNTPTLEDMLLALKAAADDDKIEGLYLNCSGAAMGMAAARNCSKPYTPSRSRANGYMPIPTTTARATI